MSDDNSAPEENANRLNPLKLAKRKKMCVYRLGTDMNGLICAVAVIRWAVGKWDGCKDEHIILFACSTNVIHQHSIACRRLLSWGYMSKFQGQTTQNL